MSCSVNNTIDGSILRNSLFTLNNYYLELFLYFIIISWQFYSNFENLSGLPNVSSGEVCSYNILFQNFFHNPFSNLLQIKD